MNLMVVEKRNNNADGTECLDGKQKTSIRIAQEVILITYGSLDMALIVGK